MGNRRRKMIQTTTLLVLSMKRGHAAELKVENSSHGCIKIPAFWEPSRSGREKGASWKWWMFSSVSSPRWGGRRASIDMKLASITNLYIFSGRKLKLLMWTRKDIWVQLKTNKKHQSKKIHDGKNCCTPSIRMDFNIDWSIWIRGQKLTNRSERIYHDKIVPLCKKSERMNWLEELNRRVESRYCVN